MWITTRYGAPTAALLMAVLLLTGCEGATTRTPKDENDPTPAPDSPDDTPRPPMGKPTDPIPPPGANRVTLDIDLEWSLAEGATSYLVFFGTDPTPDGTEFIGEQAEATFDPGRLKYDTIYYWRVDSKNEIGTITGDVWRFRTEAIPIPKPAKATSPMPVHNATNVSRTASLEWSPTPDATSYLVYLGTVQSLGSNELHGEQTGTTLQPDSTLLSDTTYYWRVDTKNNGGTTTGDVWSFTTLTKPAPKATGPQPEDGATDVGILDDLSWATAPGATSYIVYFGTAPSPGNSELRGEQASTSFDVTLQYDATYYWRVDTKNDGGTTEGDVWSFTTITQP